MAWFLYYVGAEKALFQLALIPFTPWTLVPSLNINQNQNHFINQHTHHLFWLFSSVLASLAVMFSSPWQVVCETSDCCNCPRLTQDWLLHHQGHWSNTDLNRRHGRICITKNLHKNEFIIFFVIVTSFILDDIWCICFNRAIVSWYVLPLVCTSILTVILCEVKGTSMVWWAQVSVL